MTETVRVLVLCLRPGWVAASRLPERLAGQGAQVSVICPEGALISYARPIHQLVTFQAPPPLLPLVSALHKALQESPPDLIVPGDDDARQVLHTLHAQLTERGQDSRTRALIEASLGDPRQFPAVGQKSALLALQAQGLPMPQTIRPASLEEALEFAAQVGGNTVLKRDVGAGGTGVAHCPDEDSLRAAFLAASAAPAGTGGLLLQRWVTGQTVSCNFAAWRGRLLGACVNLRERVHPAPFGVVSLARQLPDHPAQALAERVVAHFGLSGLGSVQFLLDGEGGAPLVMELNSRVTPLSTASRAFGVDLVAALLAALRGDAAPVSEAPRYERVALFPNEWQRDPQSGALSDPGVFHDVPWAQPDLLAATLQFARQPR